MRRALMTALAAAAIGFASPTFADPNGATFSDDSGPDLSVRIHASQDDTNVAPNVGPVVFGNAGPANSAGHNTSFSGFSAYDALANGGQGSGTATDVDIKEGGGFAQINDHDFDSQDAATQNLFAVIMNPDMPFTAYEFSIQLAAAGDISVYVMLTGNTTWDLVTGSPIGQKASKNNQYLLTGLTSGSFDKVLISSTAAIFELKQNSIELEGGRPPVVPEPGTWALMLVGFGGIGLAMRRRRSGKALMQVA